MLGCLMDEKQHDVVKLLGLEDKKGGLVWQLWPVPGATCVDMHANAGAEAKELPETEMEKPWRVEADKSELWTVKFLNYSISVYKVE